METTFITLAALVLGWFWGYSFRIFERENPDTAPAWQSWVVFIGIVSFAFTVLFSAVMGVVYAVGGF